MDNGQELMNRPPDVSEIAAAACGQFGFGDVIPLDWILRAFGIECPAMTTRAEFQRLQFNTLAAIQQLQDELLETHKIALRNVRGQGYELVPPQQQTLFAMSRLRDNVARELQKASKILDHIRHDVLDAQQRKDNADAVAKLAAVRSFVDRKRLAVG